MPRDAFRLNEVSDRELLALLSDAAGLDGQASTDDVVKLAGLTTKHPKTNVGVRLGYMRKIGMLARDEETHGWYLTPLGERFVSGRLTKAQRSALETLNEGSAWVATEQLSALLREAGAEQATMMRRQWQHGWLQRNNR